MRALTVAVVLSCALLGIVASDASSREADLVKHRSAENPFVGGPIRSIYFVPLDTHARALLTELAPRLEKWTPDDRRITVIAANDPKWANAKRGGQLSADKVSFGLLARLKAVHGTRPGFIYAVTSKAIYDPAVPDWRFVFGYVAYKGTNQFAAVYGTLPMRVYQPELEKARLLKMMLRYTGQMWCGLPRNSNPRSVLYQPLLSTADLDRMRPTLPAKCLR